MTVRPETTTSSTTTAWLRNSRSASPLALTRQALTNAKAAGKDYLGQTEHAVRAVQQVRSDMTASDALAAVNMVQQS